MTAGKAPDRDFSFENINSNDSNSSISSLVEVSKNISLPKLKINKKKMENMRKRIINYVIKHIKSLKYSEIDVVVQNFRDKNIIHETENLDFNKDMLKMFRNYIKDTPNLLSRLESQKFTNRDMDSQLVIRLKKIKNLEDIALQIVLVYILEKNDASLETIIKDIVNSFFYSEGKEAYILEILGRMDIYLDARAVSVREEEGQGKGHKGKGPKYAKSKKSKKSKSKKGKKPKSKKPKSKGPKYAKSKKSKKPKSKKPKSKKSRKNN